MYLQSKQAAASAVAGVSVNCKELARPAVTASSNEKDRKAATRSSSRNSSSSGRGFGCFGPSC